MPDYDDENAFLYCDAAEGDRRLLIAADFLDTVVVKYADQFDLNSWFGFDLGRIREEARKGGLDPDDDDVELETVFEPDRCGTTACACGWATKCPALRALGFVSVSRQLGSGTDIAYTDPATGSIRVVPWGGSPKVIGWKAVQLFFGLTLSEADHLFDEDAYADDFPEPPGPGPADVAARIRRFVADGRQNHEDDEIDGNEPEPEPATTDAETQDQA